MQLLNHPAVDLTVAINGYDDGASTGEVRRFLGGCLGPSDFRKNAGRFASALGSADAGLIALLDHRFPSPCTAVDALAGLAAVGRGASQPSSSVAAAVWALAHREGAVAWADAVAARLQAFQGALAAADRPFAFGDCSLGNLVFAGAYLQVGRVFNAAVADYCTMLGLPAGLIENVTDGTDAYLVALDREGALLASEEAVVDAKRRNRIDDIFLIDRRLDATDEARLSGLAVGARREWLESRAATIRANPAVLAGLAEADLIIYAPGTQHSSLFPSYLTPGLTTAVAGNLLAVKLLVTNLQADAEIAGASAVDIVDRALYYLRDKNRYDLPTPSLITHSLLNDPGRESTDTHVPLGAVEAIEDPRLVRIGNFEDGVTGRHDAVKVLEPFVTSLLGVDREPSIAVYLHDADSPNKLAETVVEMVRGGIGDLPLRITVYHPGEPLAAGLERSLPFALQAIAPGRTLETLRTGGFDYVVLFESSGMYRGEDIVALASQLVFVRLDAVWGSRRLSPRDIEAAVRLVYRHNWWLGAASRLGSHVLSALYLALFGRYVSDTLSGARAVRGRYLADLSVEPSHKLANHQLLAAILTERGELLEIPVRFLPISPDRVKRTSVWDGIRAVAEVVRCRLAPRRREAAGPGGAMAASGKSASLRKA
jgi:2-phospho-L-lactate transferase/gluconeogenesis factor (CofD/UPF0052 family)